MHDEANKTTFGTHCEANENSPPPSVHKLLYAHMRSARRGTCVDSVQCERPLRL